MFASTQLRSFLFTAAVIAAAAPSIDAQQPKDGTSVLERMRTAYADKWYHSLTFVQKTTVTRPDGTKNVSTWYESMRHVSAGVQLRIDRGDPAEGNGVLYTADSSWRFRDGKLASAAADGNPFLPLIEGVYVQPIERTVREVRKMNVDLSKVRAGRWRERDVWIVGATSASDTTSSQFWVDQQRNVVVRAIVSNTPPTVLDIWLDGYVPVGPAMLSTKIVMSSGGKVIQEEEYSNWKTDIDLPASLFDLTNWKGGTHWAKQAGSAKP